VSLTSGVLVVVSAVVVIGRPPRDDG
jgi:hypothetical protein